MAPKVIFANLVRIGVITRFEPGITLLIFTFSYEFSNNFDGKFDFGKKFVTKKAGLLEPFLS